MARTSASVVLLDATVPAASSGTKGAPGATTSGGYYDNTGNYDSPLGITIQNGATGPGTACTVVVQVADTTAGPWTDYFSATGDTVNAGLTTRTVKLDKVRFVRAIAYGNTTNNVDVKVRLHAVTGL